ncbi:unnamed protein product [Somion occarium]|uniref:MOSC domain-containing protein n=1 Tax=Somion occarium TaxID=3059160 RepID=A0ABP1CEH6_9APHY
MSLVAVSFYEEPHAVWTLTAVLLLTVLLAWHRSAGTVAEKGSAIRDSGVLSNGNGYSIGEVESETPMPLGEVNVSKILIHPIKSCRGLSVTESRFTPLGLEWCIMDAETHVLVTAREVPKMVLIESTLEYDSSDPHDGRLLVKVPQESGPVSFSVPIIPTQDILDSWSIIGDCSLFKVYFMDGYIVQPLLPSDPSPNDILTEYMGRRVFFMMKGPTPRECPSTAAFPNLKATAVFQDGFPLLFASEESLQDVAQTVRTAASGDENSFGKIGGLDNDRWKDGNVEIERFRPNIVFKGAGYPWAEDMWRSIVISPKPNTDPTTASADETFTLVSKCTRCLLPNVDTKTAERDAAVPYKVLMKFRAGKDPARMSKPCFGCNGVPSGTGIVRVGDRVFVKEWAGEGGV